MLSSYAADRLTEYTAEAKDTAEAVTAEWTEDAAEWTEDAAEAEDAAKTENTAEAENTAETVRKW